MGSEPDQRLKFIYLWFVYLHSEYRNPYNKDHKLTVKSRVFSAHVMKL